MKTKTDAMINFAYFTANFTYNFINECWKDDPIMEHIMEKFVSTAGDGVCVSCGDFLRFFFGLDKENQTKLVNWIDANYNCMIANL